MTKTDYEALVHFFRYRLNKKGRKKKRRKIKTHRRGVLSKLQKKKKEKENDNNNSVHFGEKRKESGEKEEGDLTPTGCNFLIPRLA